MTSVTFRGVGAIRYAGNGWYAGTVELAGVLYPFRVLPGPYPRPLCIDGGAYRRRVKGRRR